MLMAMSAAAGLPGPPRRLRREKRKRRELKKKAKVRAAQLLAAEGGAEEAAPDEEALFSLGAIGGTDKAAGKGAKGAVAAAAALHKVSSAAAPGADELQLLEADESDGMVVSLRNGVVLRGAGSAELLSGDDGESEQ